MDNRKIGFFDSGLGGLTCIPPLMSALPDERIIYFGDTARTPYGSKAVSTIKTFAFEIADFLVRSDVKMIVIACNTVSATCLADLRERYPEIPVLGVITPAAEAVAERCAGRNVGIIGTKVTIRSGAYRKEIESRNGNVRIFETPCPAFVPLIEEGIIDSEIMDLTIRHYMDGFVADNALDTIVLGCTHYPMIRANLARIYPELNVINPSEEITGAIVSELSSRGMLAGAENASVSNEFYASDLSENFVNMIDNIFGKTGANVAFRDIDPEKEKRD